MDEKLSPWFDAATEPPVNPGRYECESIFGLRIMCEWNRSWCMSAHITRWRGIVRRCKKCGGWMKPGKAMQQTSVGIPEWPGELRVVTMSPGGSGNLIDCAKCEVCGWSVTL